VYAIASWHPLVAIALYLRVGNLPPCLPNQPVPPDPVRLLRSANLKRHSRAVPSPPDNDSASDRSQNVAKLAARLEQNPGDVQGWIMLGRSYVNLENTAKLVMHMRRQLLLKPDDADLLGDYAFAMGMANGQRLQGQPVELINKALKLDPENPKALELAGSAAFEVKNYSQAITYWQKLMQKTPPDSELAQALSQRINEAKSLAGTAAK